MNKNDLISEVKAHIDKTVSLLSKTQEYFTELENGDFIKLGKNNTAAIVAAEVISAFQTVLFRS